MATPSLPLLEALVQPPKELRTRTAKERRIFKTTVRVHVGRIPRKVCDGMYRFVLQGKLLYADSTTMDRVPRPTIVHQPSGNAGSLIEGTLHQQVYLSSKSQPVDVVFADLNLHEPSSRHKDREFCLQFTLCAKEIGRAGAGWLELGSVETTPSYAYSHPKVLNRRRKVVLKALSATSSLPISALGADGPFRGRMHAIGGPFVPSPRLAVRFHISGKGSRENPTPSSYETLADNMELFSESVLFYDPPTCTLAFLQQHDCIAIDISITNDGRHFSNAITVTYGSPSLPKEVSSLEPLDFSSIFDDDLDDFDSLTGLLEDTSGEDEERPTKRLRARM